MIKDSKIIDSDDDKSLKKCFDILQNILASENLNLINIFKLDRENETADIESAIFDAVFNCIKQFLLLFCFNFFFFFEVSKTQYANNIKLPLKLNRCDIAKTYFLNNSDEIKSGELDDLLELALLLNRVDFVNFFLENGANLNTLTTGGLYLLYNFEEKVFIYLKV